MGLVSCLKGWYEPARKSHTPVAGVLSAPVAPNSTIHWIHNGTLAGL